MTKSCMNHRLRKLLALAQTGGRGAVNAASGQRSGGRRLNHPLYKYIELVGEMGMSRLFCFHSPDSPEVLREKLEEWIAAENWKGTRQTLTDGRWSCRVHWRRKGTLHLKGKALAG